MEIGGIDVIIPRTRGSMDECIQKVLTYWPGAKFEKGSDTEVFIYRDERGEKSWEKDLGELHSMIYLIFNDKVVTAVVDDPAETSTKNVLDLIRAVVS